MRDLELKKSKMKEWLYSLHAVRDLIDEIQIPPDSWHLLQAIKYESRILRFTVFSDVQEGVNSGEEYVFGIKVVRSNRTTPIDELKFLARRKKDEL